jgi:hypothetical protein
MPSAGVIVVWNLFQLLKTVTHIDSANTLTDILDILGGNIGKDYNLPCQP